MKNEEIKIGIKEIQNIKMTANEKENILKSVLNFSIPNKKPIHSPYSFISIFQRNHFAFYGVLSCLVIFLGSGGLILGSQKSLPGNALYPLKVKVIEPLSSAMKLSPEKKAQYEIALVKERITETQTLASQGELDTNKQQQVNDLIESHKVAFNEAVSEIKKSEPSEEIVATAVNLEQQMEENVQTMAVVTEQIAQVIEENNNTQDPEIIAMVTPESTSIQLEQTESVIEENTKNTNDLDIKNQEIAKAPNNNYQNNKNFTPPLSGTMEPMATSSNFDNSSQKYIDIALPLFTKWFEQISTDRNDVLNYTINDIIFVASKENVSERENSFFSNENSNNAFIVSVNYSVQTTEEGKRNYWLAGNGRDSENGWVLNKSIFITIDNENGTYYIKNIGTGI
jgi:hypothetical protein